MACAWKLRVIVAVWAVHLCVGPASAAAPIEVSRDLPLSANVESKFQFTSGTNRVVFQARPDPFSNANLYSVESTGGELALLNGEPVLGREILDWRISPNGTWAAFRTVMDASVQLFANSALGGTPQKLSGLPGEIEQEVKLSWFTLNSSHVLYIARPEPGDVWELFCAQSDASETAITLNGALAAGQDVAGITMSPSGQDTAYWVQAGSAMVEVHAVPTAGGESTPLVDDLEPNSRILADSVQFTSDGDHVLYVANRYIDVQLRRHDELYRASVLDGASERISGPLNPGEQVGGAVVDPNGGRIVYWVRESSRPVGIYSILSNGEALRLTPPLAASERVFEDSLSFMPGGEDLLYVARLEDDDRPGLYDEIFRVSLDGGPAEKLNGPLADGEDVDPASVIISPDGSRVIYRAGQTVGNLFDLYSVDSAGGSLVLLNGDLVTSGSVIDARITPDSERVVYLADQEVDQKFELYVVPIAGGTPTRLRSELAGGSITNWQLSPDGSQVAYRADENGDGRYELYTVNLASGLPGDYNGDGRVDAGDYVRWRNALGEPTEASINGNGDGEDGVTLSDYTWWKQHYGTPGSGSGGLAHSLPGDSPGAKYPVPEPTSWWLIGTLLCGVSRPVPPRRLWRR